MRSLPMYRRFGRSSVVLVLTITIALVATIGWTASRWTHYSDGTYEYWNLDRKSKFKWKIDDGQWWHFSTYGDWKTLSTPGLTDTFIGDGSWYDMGYGLKYRYDLNSDYGFFGRGLLYRFYYRYGPGQWYTSGCAGGWYTIGAGGMSAGVLGDGNVYNLGGGINFRYDVAHDYGFYHNVAQYRFYYRYTPGQWYTSGYGGGWYTIGSAGTCAGVLADGNVHDLGNGLWFRYNAAQDYGFYYGDTGYRFYYRYTPGQWYTSGYGGGWYVLGNAGRTAAGFFDGTAQDLGNGFAVQYDQTLDYGYFLRGGAGRFSYAYAPGQWYNQGDTTAWGALSATGISAEFVGDGDWHDVGYGFSYQFVAADKEGYFKNGDAERFYYDYAASQWYHQGDTTDWIALTAENYSAQFIGDGAWYVLDNGWSYSYLIASDYGQYKTGDADRFAYWYGLSQWLHKGDATDWGTLSAIGISAEFVGDGRWHDLGNGFTYQYVGSYEAGLFMNADSNRFYYDYVANQWSQEGDTPPWGTLSATGISAEFVGDGGWHDLGNGFTYQYVIANDQGYFKNGDVERFYYDYAAGQWYHKGDTTDWAALSATSAYAEFIGDGDWYDLGNEFLYQYVIANDQGYFQTYGGAERFYYDYAASQWYHKGDTTDGAALTSANYSAHFIGDGGTYYLGNGWNYYYAINAFSDGDGGVFEANQPDEPTDKAQFAYSYVPGQWYHKGEGTDWAPLTAANYSIHFIGDGGNYDLGNGFSYSYNDVWDIGDFVVGTMTRFYYDYSASQWYHQSGYANSGALSTTGISADFVGDGAWHDIGNGLTYQYVAANEEGYFKNGNVERFYYDYAASQWYNKGDTTNWGALSATGVSPDFVGDGQSHDLGNGWSYSYLSSSDFGCFQYDNSQTWTHYAEFEYRYGPGQWYQAAGTTLDNADWGLIGASGVSAGFIGDGAWHDLGNGWSYSYDDSDDKGYFKIGDTERFYYDYLRCDWYHKGDTAGWGDLDASRTEFIGDGQYHDLGNGFTYQYVNATGKGYFLIQGIHSRFYYDYAASQWYHEGDLAAAGGWVTLTSANYSAAFIGDGGTYDLGNGWSYEYDLSHDSGNWNEGSHTRFWYYYVSSAWGATDNSGAQAWLTGTAFSANFIGDGNWHSLGALWWYQYLVDSHTGYWSINGIDYADNNRFRYNYSSGLWQHKGNHGGFNDLGSTGWWDPTFLGDGHSHGVNGQDNYDYTYFASQDDGTWAPYGSGDNYLYKYYSGWWSVDNGQQVIWQGPDFSTSWHNPQ